MTKRVTKPEMIKSILKRVDNLSSTDKSSLLRELLNCHVSHAFLVALHNDFDRLLELMAEEQLGIGT